MGTEKAQKTHEQIVFVESFHGFLETILFTSVLSKIYHWKKFILQVEMKSSFPRWILFWVAHWNKNDYRYYIMQYK